MAEREGFEPSVSLTPHRFSRAAPSTTRTPLPALITLTDGKCIMNNMNETIFAKIVTGEIPCHKIYENETVLAFLDIEPMSEGHTLVIPKVNPKEFVWDLDDELYANMMQACRKIALHFREVTGKAHVHQKIVGTDVPYAHIHLVPFDMTSELHAFPSTDNETLKRVAEKLRLDD